MKVLDNAMMSQVNGGLVAGAATFIEVVIGGFMVFASLSSNADQQPVAWQARVAFFGMGAILLTDAYQRMSDLYAESI